MEHIWDKLESSELTPHDRMQVEFGSDFFPDSASEFHTYTQEFYIFVPSALQINSSTYTKSNFYDDVTNFIRYKTPAFTLEEINDEKNLRSPLTRLNMMHASWERKVYAIEDELKLLANTVRSSIRERTYQLLQLIKDGSSSFIPQAEEFCQNIERFRLSFQPVKTAYESTMRKLSQEFNYCDNFISFAINQYLCELLDAIRLQDASLYEKLDAHLSVILASEKMLRVTNYNEPAVINRSSPEELELLAYKESLLNKFVLDALQLKIKRASVEEVFSNWAGMVATGVATTIYLTLLINFGKIFLINSVPFLIITVLLYVLKDRIKETLRSSSVRKMFYWFPDFKTELWTPDEKQLLGYIKEWFFFMKEKALPKDIFLIRNKEFHTILEDFKRPETVLYYKRVIKVSYKSDLKQSRRLALRAIWRFNVQNFLKRASDPTHSYVTIDVDSNRLIGTKLPKVYHLNIILKTIRSREGFPDSTELKKLRVIIDKHGIKRVEHV